MFFYFPHAVTKTHRVWGQKVKRWKPMMVSYGSSCGQWYKIMIVLAIINRGLLVISWHSYGWFWLNWQFFQIQYPQKLELWLTLVDNVMNHSYWKNPDYLTIPSPRWLLGACQMFLVELTCGLVDHLGIDIWQVQLICVRIVRRPRQARRGDLKDQPTFNGLKPFKVSKYWGFTDIWLNIWTTKQIIQFCIIVFVFFPLLCKLSHYHIVMLFWYYPKYTIYIYIYIINVKLCICDTCIVKQIQ